MNINTHTIEVKTKGNSQVINLSPAIDACVQKSSVENGTLTVFVIGSTAGITTTEFEPGLATHDLAALFERIAPEHDRYLHEETWHDDNGHSHVRASLLGPGIVVPLVEGRLTLGTWQQIILIDFDTRPRDRKIVLQFMGQ
ncbi:MAG TPA: secondary thiamine-phosphate synthase enzyme YjbQ [Phycisphaerae bacterium]|nr:secondary thiamine-phosphate synthase enzyme YjbQ [Phycisphaerales bacterium]HNO78266.1 secondary thiamine-phosphate synthase enzyme YjbQ [Phycisphaerae bacterium]